MSVNFDLLDVARLRRCAKGSRWEIGNNVLYEMCQKYPTHTNQDEIIAKVWLIGRSYAAAIERRRNADEFEGDDFYAEVVGPKMHAANIDLWLKPLKRIKQPTFENCAPILSAHKQLTDLFRDFTGIDKRSLASKYLHFHFPDLFYIYDSRATRALMKLTKRDAPCPPITEFDRTYLSHFVRCLGFVTKIQSRYGFYLPPRHLDDYLVGFTR